MEVAMKAMRNNEMSSYKASRVFNLPQQQQQQHIDMLKNGRKSQVKQ